MKFIFTTIFLFFFNSCVNVNKNQIHTLENYNSIDKYKKPIALLLYSSLYPKKDPDLSFLSDFTIITVDIEKFPNSSSRYFYKKLPSIFFIDSNGNSIFSFDLASDKEKIKKLIPNIKKEIVKSKLKLSEEDLSKNLNKNLISPNEARNIIEIFFQNLKHINKKNSLNFIKQNTILPSIFDRNNKQTNAKLLSLNIKNELLNVDPIFGGVWSKNGEIKKLSSFLEFANPTIMYTKFCNKDLKNIIDFNIESSEKYFVSVLYNKENNLFYPAIQYKPKFNLIITEDSLNKNFDQNMFNYFEKIFLFSYPKLINGKRFLKIKNKTSINADFLDDKIDKLRSLFVKNINARILKELFAYPNLLMTNFIAMRNNENINKAISLYNNIKIYFTDKGSLIKTHTKGIPYLRDQVAYINSALNIYSINYDHNFLDKATDHAKITINNFCKNTQKVTYCSDTSFSYLNNYLGYFNMPNYSIKDNANFAKVLIKIYNYSNDEFFLKTAHKILSSFYKKGTMVLESGNISNSLFTYISSLQNLYTNPFYIYLPSQIRNSKKIIETASKVFNNNIVVKMFDSSKPITINSDSYKINNRGIILCINKTCETLKYFNEKYFDVFLEKNYYKTIRIFNY